MNRASILPYTEAERERDRNARAEAVARMQTRRKATPSGQDYNQWPTQARKRRDLRILGEREDA